MKVSVCMITYNQQRFLPQALDSVFAQRTQFPMEIVLADDCSGDGTVGVAEEYRQRSPHPFRLLTATTNLGVTPNLARALGACTGEYVALLEGDDYWTDPLKLQRQLRCLDERKECAVSFHPVQAVDEDDRYLDRAGWPKLRRDTFTLRDLLSRGNFLPTCSVVFRNRLFDALPQWFSSRRIGDLPLHALNARFGHLCLLPEVMAVYRRHPGGVYSGERQAAKVEELLAVYADLDSELGPRYRDVIASAQLYLRAAEACRLGDDDTARRAARARALGRPANVQTLKALLIALSPPLYRQLAARRAPDPLWSG